MKKALNILLLISFAVAIGAPITGIHIHKLASTAFFLLSVIHMVVYRKKLGSKRWLLFIIILVSFLGGLLGLILDRFSIILNIHRVVSIVLVFFLAIHVFVFHKNFFRKFTREKR